MAYCRFSDGDVYIFPHVAGGFECCGCALHETSWGCETRLEMMQHMREHKMAGHRVPYSAIERIAVEFLDEGDLNSPDSDII